MIVPNVSSSLIQQVEHGLFAAHRAHIRLDAHVLDNMALEVEHALELAVTNAASNAQL